MAALSRMARAYIALVAIAALAATLPGFTSNQLSLATLVVAGALYVFVESISTTRMVAEVSVSAGFPVALAALILLGPHGAAMIGLLAALCYEPGGVPAVKRLFNGSQLALAGFCGGLVYEWLGGARILTLQDFPGILAIVLAAAATFALVNALLLSGVVGLAERQSFLTVWRGMISKTVVPYFGYGLFGLMMAVLWSSEVGVLGAVLVLLPLLVARWAFAEYAAEREAYDRTVRTLVQAVETKDYYTRGHSERVSRGAVMIARQTGMHDDRVQLLRLAGILHDLGKLGVPTRVLQKAGALTDAEFSAIKLHPARGVEIVRDIEFLREAYEGIMHHHERVDGRGYPMGLAGDAIPEFARVIAVADAFDSMTTTRSYRAARSIEEALAELERSKGSHFDPVMVSAFLAAIAKEGWELPEVPEPAEGAEVTRYDHDDPAFTVPASHPDTP